jgi:hypothetical protein
MDTHIGAVLLETAGVSKSLTGRANVGRGGVGEKTF